MKISLIFLCSLFGELAYNVLEPARSLSLLGLFYWLGKGGHSLPPDVPPADIIV